MRKWLPVADVDWPGWLRSSLQTTTFLGLALIALMWGGVEFYLNSDRARAESSAIQNTANLARLFEEHIVRQIKDNDRVLRQLQLSSVNGTLAADFPNLAPQADELSEPAVSITLINTDGIVTASNAGPLSQKVDLSDRDHFVVHRESAEAGLFISKPRLGAISKKWSILLTRALRAPHGEFAGVAVAAIYADKLARFYETIDLGSHGAINLVGLDGVVRASAGMQTPSVGKSMRDTELLRAAGKADEGWFTTPGMIDGVKRVVSFRKVDGYPLVLAIGRSQNDVFRQHWYRRDTSRALACALTLFILIVIWVNIRHRKGLEIARAERRTSEMIAQEKSRELELTLEHMSQGIVMVGADHRIAFANGRAVELLDLPEFVHSRPRFEDLMAFHLARGEYGKDGNLVIPQVWQAIKAGDYYRQGSYERTRPNGVTLEVRTSPLPDGGIVRTFTDISERKRNEQKIAHMAHHDALTGLANRVLLRSHIETALRRHRRQGEGAALLLIDLDHFKKVNDTLGHGAGDELLRCVAQRLQGCVRELDTVARLGGDEFAVLQVAIDTHVAIARLASRVVAALSAPYELDGRPARIGVSIGIACSVDCQDIAQMFHNADLALYRVKAEGRNGYRLFEPEMDEAAKARRQLEENLREAQVRGEFEIYYQPIIDLGSGRITTVEALLRWNHPKRGLLSPADFMPVAEEIGMMPAIDSWVLNAACSEAKQWPGDTAVAVNLSPAKFRRRTVVDVVRNTLASTGLPAKRLELEISEKTILQETDSSNAVLLALHGLGVSIALDDFGVGYSSLSDLRTFRFDKIKIDKLFVSEIEHRNDCAAIVAAVAGLGRSLGAQTTAEGVETETQARLVRAAGCTQVQGYLYSRPVTASAIRSMLAIQATDRQAVA